MPRIYNDSKLKLGEPLATKLRDFCKANYNAATLEIIREALNEHIDQRLKNPEMKERYEAARRARLKLPDRVVALIKKGDSSGN